MLTAFTLLVIAPLASWPPPRPEERELFERARPEYESGGLEEPAKSFQILARSETAIGPLASFALANVRVRQATQPGIEHPPANGYLEEAIRLYRTVLDRGPAYPLVAADVRHNLELAKRLLRPTSRRSDGARQRARNDVSQPEPARAGSPTMPDAPEPSVPSRSDAGVRPTETQEHGGPVQRPLPGLPFLDPGPLSVADAKAKLSGALGRIEQERQAHLRRRQTQRPKRRGDY